MEGCKSYLPVFSIICQYFPVFPGKCQWHGKYAYLPAFCQPRLRVRMTKTLLMVCKAMVIDGQYYDEYCTSITDHNLACKTINVAVYESTLKLDAS